MESSSGNITVQTMASILRDHRTHPDPAAGLAGADICMHASFGPIRGSQSTASMIVSLDKNRPLVFATGTSAPCTGIFKPYWVDAPPSDQGQSPQGQFDPKTTFWSHERLHREVLENYPDKIKSYREDRDKLEEEFFQEGLALSAAPREERRDYTEACIRKAAEAEEDWLDRVLEIPEKKKLFHDAAWNGFNKAAGFE